LRRVVTRVLERQRNPDRVAHFRQSLRCDLRRFIGEWKRQQVVEETIIGSTETQVLAVPWDLEVRQERSELVQVAIVEGLHRTQARAQPMRDDRPILSGQLQHFLIAAATVDVIFGVDLYPGDALRASREELCREVISKPQADSGDVSSHLISRKERSRGDIMPPRLPTPCCSITSSVTLVDYLSPPQEPSPQEPSPSLAPLQLPSPQEASASPSSAGAASSAAAASAPAVASLASGPSSDLHAAVMLSAAVAIAMIVCLSAEFMFLSSFL
jgi:hypothetical protein